MARRPTTYVAIIAAVLASGCGPNPSYVYVDLSRALMPSAAPSPGLPPTLPGASAGTSSTFELPASPLVVEGRSSTVGANKVEASIAQNRERTYNVIVRRLHDDYVREAAALRRQKLASFEPIQAKIIAAGMDKLSKAYIAYADEVGPKIARLAVTAGFPDPDPKGRRKPSGTEGLDTLAYETSQRLRAEIGAARAKFQKDKATILASRDNDVDVQQTALLAEVAKQVGDVDTRAEADARREVSQAQAQLGTLLADRPPTPLPATPESRVVVSSPGIPAPSISARPNSASWTGDDLERVKQDLNIWLSVNKYIQRARGKGRDATEEFIAWRKRFRQEPSAQP